MLIRKKKWLAQKEAKRKAAEKRQLQKEARQRASQLRERVIVEALEEEARQEALGKKVLQSRQVVTTEMLKTVAQSMGGKYSKEMRESLILVHNQAITRIKRMEDDPDNYMTPNASIKYLESKSLIKPHQVKQAWSNLQKKTISNRLGETVAKTRYSVHRNDKK